MTPAQKAAGTRKKPAAATKAAATKKRRAAGAKAALTRKRKAAVRKAAETRRRKAAAMETGETAAVEQSRYSADDRFSYLNTDLDLTSAGDLRALATAFETQGVQALHVTHGEDGMWYATFEVHGQHDDPEPTITTLLGVIESLDASLQAVWTGCTRREFNIGYDCGASPGRSTKRCRGRSWDALQRQMPRCASHCIRRRGRERKKGTGLVSHARLKGYKRSSARFLR
jgi:hypothetical protein